MAGNIKGITIEFRGETTKLDKALREINSSTKALDKELRTIDKALKFNPTSVELWRQKQQVLTQKVNETRDKLEVLKKAQAEMDAKGVDKNSEEYRKLQRDIIVTENQVKNFESQLRKIGQVNLRATSEKFKEIGTSLESAGRSMKGISVAAAGVVASLGAISYKAGTAADDLNTLSKVTGIGTQELQKYSYAADLVDVSTETIAKANKKLTKSAYDAANGSKSQVAAFEALGVSVKDNNGELRDSEEIFQDVLGALGQMTNETERDALAQKLLGKSASELNPLIEDGGKTYKMVADTLEKYNLDYIDQETLDKANQFNDQLDTMKLLGSVAFAQVGSELAAYLAPALEKVVDLVGKFADWLGNLDPEILATVAAIAGVVAAIAPVLIVLGKLSFAISSIMSLMATAGPVIAAIAGPIGIVIAVIAGVVAAFVLWKKHGDKIKKFFVEFGKKISKVWTDMKKSIQTALENIKTTITNVFNSIKSFIQTVISSYVAIAKTQFELMKTAVTTVINGIKNTITTVFNAIKSFIQTVVAAYVAIIRAEFNLAKTIVTTAVNAIKTTVTTVFNAVKTAVSTAWNGIKTAITTPINAAQSAVSSVVNSIKSKVTGSFSGISGTVRSAFNAVKDAITSPIQKAWDLVKSAIDKIKGIFPIKLGKIFSGIKLPHFKISGGKIPWGIGGQGEKPSINIEWYKRGGIFSSPSVIGVGEAGKEAVVPLDKFWDKLDRLAEAATGGGTVINVYAPQGMDVNALAAKIEQVLVSRERQRGKAYGNI